jgi:hypothetical protein
MKWMLLGLILSSSVHALSIKGRVSSTSGCGDGKVMVWLSKMAEEFQQKELLMHTLVPLNGTYEFYVIPGQYRVEVSTEKGCEEHKNIFIVHKEARVDFVLRAKK